VFCILRERVVMELQLYAAAVVLILVVAPVFYGRW
jgi:hypothetical protein